MSRPSSSVSAQRRASKVRPGSSTHVSDPLIGEVIADDGDQQDTDEHV
jgi:hypothetical protein